MKKLLFSSLLITLFSLSACKKESTPAPDCSGNATVSAMLSLSDTQLITNPGPPATVSSSSTNGAIYITLGLCEWDNFGGLYLVNSDSTHAFNGTYQQSFSTTAEWVSAIRTSLRTCKCGL